MELEHVLVVGAGQMGGGIAQVVAASGRRVSLHDPVPGAYERALETRDRPGFVSNRILMPFINEAVYTLHEGVAEASAIDTVARLGFAHPLGPLALADLIGLDTCVAVMEVLERGLGDPKYGPCSLLRENVAAGRLGRK